MEKCLHIQSQRNANIRPFVAEQASSTNSLSSKHILHQDTDRASESNEQIQGEFSSQSGFGSAPQESMDDRHEVLVTEESAADGDRRCELAEESRLFTFQKEG